VCSAVPLLISVASAYGLDLLRRFREPQVPVFEEVVDHLYYVFLIAGGRHELSSTACSGQKMHITMLIDLSGSGSQLAFCTAS
jgi:hypothetical protein